MGRIGAPFGVRGASHVESFTEPPEALGEFRTWHVRHERGERAAYRVSQFRAQGRKGVVSLEGVETRDGAAALTGAWIEVERDALPEPGGNEHYWVDLVGLSVRNLEGVDLGRIDHFVETAANAVMVVKGEREHWLPVTPQHLTRVDREAGLVIVDWPADF